MRIKLGRGVVGQAAQRAAVDPGRGRPQGGELHRREPDVKSELAVPLIVKNRVIGVIDLQSEQIGVLHRGASAAAGVDGFAHGDCG